MGGAGAGRELTEDEKNEMRSLRDDDRYYTRRIPEVKAEIEPYNRETQAAADTLRAAIAVKSAIEANLTQARRDNQVARGTLDRIDDRINQLLSIDKTEGIYKLALSIAFAGLIGVVILGFFKLANIDAVVRQQIFSGDAGLQFITLFALVIAIILFGIIGVLEGRELSALLGGISGYILGRSNVRKAIDAIVQEKVGDGKGGGKGETGKQGEESTEEAVAEKDDDRTEVESPDTKDKQQ